MTSDHCCFCIVVKWGEDIVWLFKPENCLLQCFQWGKTNPAHIIIYSQEEEGRVWGDLFHVFVSFSYTTRGELKLPLLLAPYVMGSQGKSILESTVVIAIIMEWAACVYKTSPLPHVNSRFLRPMLHCASQQQYYNFSQARKNICHQL